MRNIVSIGYDRVVITGLGIVAAVGHGREAVWRAVQCGRSGVQRIRGVPGIPNGSIPAAMVDIHGDMPGQLKNIPLCLETAAEALADAGVVAAHGSGEALRPARIDGERFGCFISGHMGDTSYIPIQFGRRDLLHVGAPPWHEQWLPHSAHDAVRRRFGLYGPSSSVSTACASGTIDFLKAVRAIHDEQCDIAIAGASESIHPIFAAGFQNMRALASHDDPAQACRPFDADRTGFVLGEGAAMLVVERLSHARRRGAGVYAEILGGGIVADAHHLTGVDADSNALHRLITETLHRSHLVPRDIDYISAHGTGTRQNDVAEVRGIRRAFGIAANSVCISSIKSMLGHLVNASGCVELALTALALRDGFTPPTINLTNPDPACDLDCIPLVGRRRQAEHALKLSLAFGGHMAAVALRRWDTPGEARQALPVVTAAAA